MIAQRPFTWPYSNTGSVYDGFAGLQKPSQLGQPKFRPRPPPAALGAKSTSSQVLWPTSAITRSPVAESNEKRHGLRTPFAQISPRPVVPAYGLSAGTSGAP